LGRILTSNPVSDEEIEACPRGDETVDLHRRTDNLLLLIAYLTVTEQGKTTQDVVFLVTSRPPAHACPAQLLTWIRGHWSIEARHHVRDGAFGEDRARLRQGHTPQIMAACRNLCITLLHRSARTEISAARRSLAYHPAQALALLLPKTRRA